MRSPASARAVVDASVAVKWILDEPHTAEARALLVDLTHAGRLISAPSWFGCEVGNVLFQRVRQGNIRIQDAHMGLRTVLNAVTLVSEDPAVAERALVLAERLGQRACYDSQYLALAERERVDLWTDDHRFWAAAHENHPRVHWLGGYSARPAR